MQWPRIVAEALRVPEAPPAPAPPGAAREDGAWERALAAAWRPAEVEGHPPPWLRSGQVTAWRRTAAAVGAHGGALLAEPVGAGKTWIALAVAATRGGRATVVAPAILLPQWRAAAAAVPVRVACHSLERCSRGVPPPPNRGLAIVDEAHRLRHPGTRRAATMVPWLAGREVLLLTGTPIVNRRADLLHLLRLALADGALAADGLATLGAITTMACPHPALRRVVIRGTVSASDVVLRRRVLACGAAEQRRGIRAARGIGSLRLAEHPGVRRLLVAVLADAAASSDAAWHAALRRLRALLVQAREAGGANRAMLRHFAGDEAHQGVLWSLVAPELADQPSPLPLVDLPRLDALLAQPADDTAWLDELAQLLGDDLVTVIFCRHRATAAVVRDRLGPATAWLHGAGAGIGPHRLDRTLVLGAFGPHRNAWRGLRSTPRVLVATDVAAEGLDLQAAARLIHLDLPWTAMRRDQRDGRLRRPGQQAPCVSVVERHPSPPLERLVALAARVRRKGHLAAQWLDALAGMPGPRNARARLPPPGTTLWVLTTSDGRSEGSIVVADEGGEPRVLAPDEVVAVVTAPPHRLQPVAVPPVARLAATVVATARLAAQPPPPCRALVWRAQRLARAAARDRDVATLGALETLLAHAAAPASLGIRRRLEALRTAPDAALVAHGLPPAPPRRPPGARLVAGAVVVAG